MPTKKEKNIYQKLAVAKAEIGAISKDSTNPFFKSKYFDINNLLAHVEPILQKNGLICLQPIIDGSVVTKIVDVDCIDFIESSIALTDERDPQKLGSQISYFRRYTLSSLLAIQAEDDDANSAKPKTKPALQLDSEQFKKALQYMSDVGDISAIEKKYSLSTQVKKALNGSN
jgi:hypothetical protein